MPAYCVRRRRPPPRVSGRLGATVPWPCGTGGARDGGPGLIGTQADPGAGWGTPHVPEASREARRHRRSLVWMVGHHCGRPTRGGLRRYMDGARIGGSLRMPAGAGHACLTATTACRSCRVAAGRGRVRPRSRHRWLAAAAGRPAPSSLRAGHRPRPPYARRFGLAQPGPVTTVRRAWAHGALAGMSSRLRLMLIRVVLRSGPVSSGPRSEFSSANPADGIARDVTKRLRPVPHVSAASWGPRRSNVGP